MLTSYLDQLSHAAKKAGVELLPMYLAAGLTDSQYYRHRAGSNEPNLKTANKIMDTIHSEFQDQHGVALDLR